MPLFPPGVTPASFLSEYWQRRPLLMRGALRVPDAVSADELAGLACEEDIEARIVMEGSDGAPWQVRHGPFEPGIFATLPAARWTLLVQDVDKVLPEVASVLDEFRFLPDWRIDDVMISYAADQGSVGPHTDDYDVFLIQAEGRRRWEIQRETPADAELIPDLELRVLRRFEPDTEWVLEPGDVLYLPPRIAHWGTALGPCMTWSVGFRAPSAGELAAGWVEHQAGGSRDVRYRDPAAGIAPHPGEITAATVEEARRLMAGLLDADSAAFGRWFGGFVSEPKAHLSPMPPEKPVDPEKVWRTLHLGGSLGRAPGARILFHRQGGRVHLAASGVVHDLPASLGDLAALLADRRHIPGIELIRWSNDPEALALLTRLYNDGQWEFVDEP